MSKTLTLKPRVSEKAYGLSQTRNTYVFDVPKTTNKQEIAAAVTTQFDVTVVSVNVTIRKGKVKRSYRKGGRPTLGRDVDVKKAYVRLKDGDHIPVFAAEEVVEEKPAKETKVDKTDNAKKVDKPEKKSPLKRLAKEKK